MPLGFHHKNRSRQALNDPAAGTGPGTPSSGSVSGDEARTEAAARDREARAHQAQAQAQSQGQGQGQNQGPPLPQPPPFGGIQRTGTQPYTAQGIAPDHDPRGLPQQQQQQTKPGEATPSRSSSTRFSGGGGYHQHPPPQSQVGGSADNLLADSRRYQQPPVAQSLQPPAPEPKKRGIFDRISNRASNRHTSDQKPPPSSSNPGNYNNTTGLGRRLSKKEQASAARNQQNVSLEQQRLDWQAAQDSRTHLPSPLEGNEDDSGLDPYLVRETDQGSHQPALIEANYPQTIRTVQGDIAPLEYHNDERQQFEAQKFDAQQQHLRDQLQQQSIDIGTHNYYQSHLQQPQVNISPASAISTSDPYRQQNAETGSQISYDSPVDQREEQRPVSVQSNNGQSPTPALAVPHRGAEHPNRTASIPQGARPQSLYSGGMAPPPTGPSNRRSADPKQTLQGAQQGQGSSEPPPNYSRGQFVNAQTPTPGLISTSSSQGGGPPGPNYRGGPPQREQSGVGDQGRSTPPPPSAPSGQDIHELYKEISTKYKKVKGLYFEKTAQVEQLQNTLANQRLSQSRTSLDDSEYMTRFQRLEGAVTNLAFNIRKDWRSVPPWISQYVNKDALSIGRQEMTAVGRACITKFIVEEIFNRTFHPGLDPELSVSLKQIEQNIRLYSPALNNLEESEALTAKVVQWRLATLEGLKGVLMSPESEAHKAQFSRVATTNLAGNLISFLEPVPPGLEDSAHMIIELAVGIVSNIPLESRDISVVYPMPGDMLQPLLMKIENPIAALENPGAECGDGDAASTTSGEKDEGSKDADKSSDGKGRKDKSKSGMLSGLIGGSSTGAKKQTATEPPIEVKKISTEDGAQKVRFAGFVSVEVRGRQVLVKAPVWTVS